MKKFYALTLIFLSCCSVSFAQKEWNVWHFGTNAGIDFNSGTAVSITGGIINTVEGEASICNASTGALLFYTDGITVRNRSHAVMPNGTGLTGNTSTTQSALIIQRPGSANLYYVFTLPTSGNYCYSVVDMTLAAGMGDVVVASKNTVISNNNTEKQTAVRHANGVDWWIITHEVGTANYRAYLFTAAGLNTTPVVSAGGNVISAGGAIGYIASNNAGNRLATTNYNSGNMEVVSFNNATGMVSAPITLTGFAQCYGVAFSPNDQLLYVTNFMSLLQFNLSSGVQATIQASQVTLATESNWMRALMPGPDGKIYVCREFLTVLGTINSPNTPGTGCTYVPNGLTLAAGTSSQLGLPNIPRTVGKCLVVDTIRKTLCTGQSYVLNGRTYTTSGTYIDTARSTVSCDTAFTLYLTVGPPPPAPVVTSPLRICQFDVAAPLTATGASLLWYSTPTGGTPSATAPVPPTTVPGTYHYYVSQTVSCESQRSQITVIVNPKPAPPTVISPLRLCQYDTVSLTASGAPNATFTWYYTATGGAGVPNIIPSTAYEDSAYYYVTQTVNGCESDRTRLQVFVSYKPNGIVLPNRIWVCEGELDSFSYFGNATPPQAVFNWTTSRPNNQIVSGQGTTGPLVVRFDSAGLHYVRVQVNNRGCLSEIASQPVSVRPNPYAQFVVKSDACQDEVINVALTAISPKIDSFKYFFPGAQIVYGTNSGGPYGIRYNTPGIKVISTMATTRECPSRMYYDTVNVHPLPDTRFVVGSRTGNCAGDSALLRIVNGDSATRYVWTPDHFFSAGNIFEAWGVVKSSGYVKVNATSGYGCKAADSVLINAGSCCELYFPNAFSPNGDTKNDVFRPVTNGHQEIRNFRIINRWGQVVYESKEDRGGWDGTFNGKPQEVGAYYYYIHYNCRESGPQDVEQKGEVMLLR